MMRDGGIAMEANWERPRHVSEVIDWWRTTWNNSSIEKKDKELSNITLMNWEDWWWWYWLRRWRCAWKRMMQPERARRVDANRVLNDGKRPKTDWDMLTFWCRPWWEGLWWQSDMSTTDGPIWTILGAFERYDRVVYSVERRKEDAH
jgi:hypothetical protein